MGNILTLKYPKQVVFFEVLDSPFNQEILADINLSESNRSLFSSLCDALKLELEDPEAEEQYFKMKAQLYEFPLFNATVNNNFVSYSCNISKLHEQFPKALPFLEKAFAILIEQSDFYSEISDLAFRNLREQVLVENIGVHSIEYSTESITFHIPVNCENSTLAITEYLNYRWFLDYAKLSFNLKNDNKV